MLRLIVACGVYGRRLLARGARGWAAYSLITGVVALVLCAWPALEWSGVRLSVAIVLGFVWQTALSVRVRRKLG